MKASREDIEKFDAYIRGEMDSEERLLFESALATDETLASEFELHQWVTEGIASEKEARFRAVLAQQRQDTFIGNNTWGRKFTIASAAIVTLGFLVVLFATYRMNNPSNQLAKQDKELEDSNLNPPSEIKEGNKGTSELDDKTKAYAKDERNDSTPDSMVEREEFKALEENDEAEEAFDFNHDLESKGDANSNLAKPEMREDENVSFSSEDIDDVTIAKDQLMSKETVQIKQLDVKMAPIRVQSNVSLDKAEAKKSRAKTSNNESVAGVTDFAPVDSAERENKQKLKVESRDSVSSQSKAERISVEYYKSPLNYKGYTYDERLKKIIVYGLNETKSTLLKYQNILYLKNGKDFYKIIPTTQYLRYNKVTDKSLISTLNQ